LIRRVHSLADILLQHLPRRGALVDRNRARVEIGQSCANLGQWLARRRFIAARGMCPNNGRQLQRE
jgi:hypothetical protein